jgi:hypothetical protein
MKLTKTSLRSMILKEINISIGGSGAALEEDEELEEELGSGMTSYLDTEAANTTYTTSHGYKGDNMSTIAEGDDFEEEVSLSEAIADLEDIQSSLDSLWEKLKSIDPDPGNEVAMAHWDDE